MKKNKNAKRLLLSLLFCILMTAILPLAVSASDIGCAGDVLAKEVTLTKTNLLGQTTTFSQTDIKCALDVTDFKSVTITSLPASNEGSLLYRGRRVTAGQTVKRRNLEALTFTPADQTVTEAVFNLSVDAGSKSDIRCRLRFIDRVNYAPFVQENASAAISTRQKVSYFGKLAGNDPEGDLLTYRVIAAPENGRVEVDAGSGNYRYRPYGDFMGKDSFVYIIEDEYGNYSMPAEVEISVTERSATVEYVDMINSENYNAALTMTEKEIMAGTLLGDGVYFLPDAEVSRAEFVVMAMKAKGIKQDSTLKTSYFDDNEEIPASYVSYIATAQKIGIINGTFAGGKLLFRPNETITKYEASVVLNRLFECEESYDLSVISGQNDIPSYAKSSVAAMIQAGIFSSAEEAKGKVTRQETARYLYSLTD